MTVKVTLPNGTTDDYMRFGDAYVEHQDGSLDVIRNGAKEPYHYAAAEWTKVEGDQTGRKKKRRIWRSRFRGT